MEDGMNQTFERIINLGSGGETDSTTLDQHCSAMRMDDAFNYQFNKLNYAISDARKMA